MEQAKIELTRVSQFVNSARKFKIYIDGELETEICNGSRKIIKLFPGKHTILVKLDWCKSKEINLNLKSGEKKKLICGSKLVGWKKIMILFNIFLKNKFLFLDFYSEDKMMKYQEKSLKDLKEEGMLRFVIKQGVLGWGIFTGSFVSVINFILYYDKLTFIESLYRAALLFVVLTVSGIIPGLLMWFISSK